MGNIQMMKGIVHPKRKYLSLFTHLHVVPESYAVIYSVKGEVRSMTDRLIYGEDKRGWRKR